LELKGRNGNIIALSQTAFNNFAEEQKEKLGKYAKLVPININKIEEIGGGSVRCMIAELY